MLGLLGRSVVVVVWCGVVAGWLCVCVWGGGKYIDSYIHIEKESVYV